MNSFLRFFTFCIIIVVLFSFFQSCAPEPWRKAKICYEKGDMVNAVFFSAQTLKENPGYDDAAKFLQNDVPNIYSDFYNKAKNCETAVDWDCAFDYYSAISRISDIISSIPIQHDKESNKILAFQTKNVNNEIENARTNAAEKHYQLGLMLEKSNENKESAKEFSRCLNYINPYKDAEEHYKNMKAAAIQRIAILNFENRSGVYDFGAIGENLSEHVINSIMSHKNREFLQLISKEKIKEILNVGNMAGGGYYDPASLTQSLKNSGVNAYLIGKITSITIDYATEKHETIDEFKDVYNDDTHKNEKLKAKVKITTRAVHYSIDCSYQLIDASSGTILKSASVPNVKDYYIQFANYDGDKRALSDNSIKLCNNRDEHFQPPERIIPLLLNEIAADIANDIVDFYR